MGQTIDYDLAELLLLFDSFTEEEDWGGYYFEHTRVDGIKVGLSFPIYFDLPVFLHVEDSNGVTCVWVELTSCSKIRVLELERKTLELLDGQTSYFVALLGDPILSIKTMQDKA